MTTGSMIVDMAERVNDARRAAETPPAILVGHSMGCRVVLEAARRLPDAVEGLVLIEESLRAVVVPRGVEHRTAADEGAEVLVFEPVGVLSTGAIKDDVFTPPMGVEI